MSFAIFAISFLDLGSFVLFLSLVEATICVPTVRVTSELSGLKDGDLSVTQEAGQLANLFSSLPSPPLQMCWTNNDDVLPNVTHERPQQSGLCRQVADPNLITEGR